MYKSKGKRAMKTVWILGAGFSQPLGGPLLKDWFTEKSLNKIISAYPRLDTEEFVECTQYFKYITDVFTYLCTEKLYIDAEEFVADLGDAALNTDSDKFRYILNIIDKLHEEQNIRLPGFHGLDRCLSKKLKQEDILKLYKYAQDLIVSSCSYFLENDHIHTEMCKTYVDWYTCLNKNDTIITFNYDFVLENISKISSINNKFIIVRPGVVSLKNNKSYILHDKYYNAKEYNTKILVFKLHGSVTFCTKKSIVDISNNGISKEDYEEIKYSVYLKDITPIIGLPGSMKQKITHSDIFLGLRNLAKKYVKEAEHIIFVGYRFPESDTLAMKELLSAIIENPNRSNGKLKISTVLGKDIESDDSNRLFGLLKTIDCKNIEKVQSNSSDFLLMTSLLRQHNI